MSDAPASPALPPPCPAEEADWAQALAMRRLQMLGELAEIGLEVARAVERQASAPAAAEARGPIFNGDLALAYARVSRAVRLTLMLQARLIEEMKASGKARAEAEEEPDPSSPEYRRKARVERIVERLAEAEHPDAEDTVTDLVIEAGERLDDEDLYGDLLERPVSELVARLCKDLGLEPDWSELAGELWAVREVQSGEVGWPLAGRVLPRERPRAAEGRERPEATGLDAEPADGAFAADTG